MYFLTIITIEVLLKVRVIQGNQPLLYFCLLQQMFDTYKSREWKSTYRFVKANLTELLIIKSKFCMDTVHNI